MRKGAGNGLEKKREREKGREKKKKKETARGLYDDGFYQGPLRTYRGCGDDV